MKERERRQGKEKDFSGQEQYNELSMLFVLFPALKEFSELKFKITKKAKTNK